MAGASKSSGSARLPVILAFTFLNATCAGLVTTALFFSARGSYGFGQTANYGLGIVLGGAYTIGAMLAARVVSRFGGRARATLVGLLVLLAGAVFLPTLDPGAAWVLWGVAACYGLFAAVLWPIVHSYLSGGRAGGTLRRAVSMFNVTWGSALVFGYWFLGPSMERSPEVTLRVLGVLHLVSASCLALLPARPPGPGSSEVDEAGDQDLSTARELREVFQRMLPVTNLLGFALAPFLPDAFLRLGLPEAARVRFAVAWLLPRAVVFGLMGVWQGWHGRRGTASFGFGALVGGFALAVLAPRFDTGTAGLVLEALGLMAFGTGMAVIYTAAFYYAQTAGRSEVGAGGRHEALLGFGATVGPSFGALIAWLVSIAWVPEAQFEVTLAGVCVGVSALLGWRAFRRG